MRESRFQKQLDKKRLAWYTTRKEVSPDLSKIPEGTISLNKEVTKELREGIEEVGKILKQVCKRILPDAAPPIIAGGAIRDMAFGLAPKDFDIFFDTSSIPAEERDDATLLLGTVFLEELVSFGVAASSNLVKEGEDYAQDERWSGKDFTLYSSANVGGTPFQFIGYNDSRLSSSPEEFLEEFDWPLVKCFYSTKEDSFYYSDEFCKAVETRKVTATTLQTSIRIRRWLNRHNFNKTRGPIQLIDKYPPPHYFPLNKYTQHF